MQLHLPNLKMVLHKADLCKHVLPLCIPGLDLFNRLVQIPFISVQCLYPKPMFERKQRGECRYCNGRMRVVHKDFHKHPLPHALLGTSKRGPTKKPLASENSQADLRL